MYKIISGKTLPIQFKIKVNPEQSRALQQYLLNAGIGWGSANNVVKNEDSTYLYISPCGIYHDSSNSSVYFDSHLNLEIQFEDYFEPIASSISTSTPSKLRELLEGMTQEAFDKAWEEIKNLKLIGPTIEEYLKSK